ncbi:MAG: 3-phosphoshikimate 1-carboxyvinyltransferase [Bacteroidota bacterium]
MFKVSKKNKLLNGEINISGSKSESNRLLVLRAYTSNFEIKNISNSDDTQTLLNALNSNQKEINIGHAGTAMRFLTSYFASKNNSDILLTGSKRMQERPISVLVDALKDLGADIRYIKNEGYPPLKIKGRLLNQESVKLTANISSQYISSLMMLGVSLKKGLEIKLSSELTSRPYLKMTIEMIKSLGGHVEMSSDRIFVKTVKDITKNSFTVESDWSSASYFYSLASMCDNVDLTLNTFFDSSIQGDSKLVEIYDCFGVKTIFNDNKIQLIRSNKILPKKINLDLNDTPDLAQTIVISCLANKIDCDLTGLHTLKIKETDRLIALKNEIQKFGVDKIEITDDSLHLRNKSSLKPNIIIDTYNDHRMAMSFACLSLVNPIIIKDPMVVTKSYKNFWTDLEKLGFRISKK